MTFKLPTTFELKLNPAAFKLLPVMLPVTLRADTTFELRLNPVAFKLAAVMLPAAETMPSVVMFPEAASNVILPVVRPFLTLKFLVVIVPYSPCHLVQMVLIR